VNQAKTLLSDTDKRIQARASKPQGSGLLADKLAAQKKAGMKGALQQASEENRRARDADAVAETRNYN